MLWSPICTLVIQMPVAALNVGYRRPRRATRRKAIYGKGGKPMRNWGLYG